MSVLALDIGTTALKIGVFGTKSQLLSLTRVPCGVSFSKPGWAQASPQAWWNIFLRELPKTCAVARVRPCDVEAIGLSTLCPALIPMDSKGTALHDAIIYLDQRSMNEVGTARRAVSDKAFARITGNRIAPGTTSLSSILWLKQNRPAICRRGAVFGHANTFVGHKLTGNFGIDWTNASLTGLFDIRKRQWSPELCEAFKIPADRLPAIHPAASVIGVISPEVSRLTGLKAGTPVAMGAADTACSALALGVKENAQAFASSGGSDVITVCTDTPKFDTRFLNRCHAIQGRWLIHGTVSTSGSAVEWFRGLLAGRDYDQLISHVRKSPDGANGVIFLPYLMGERSPLWNPHIRGAFLGLTAFVGINDMTRAIFEGVGYALRQIFESMERHMDVKLRNVVLVGNGARNMTWAQIRSDITGKTFFISPLEEAALRGAAMLAMMATSKGRALATADSSQGRVISPRKIKQHDENYAVFERNLSIISK